MLTELVRIDIQVKFLYAGMILKGDAFDENGELVLTAHTPVTDELISALKVKGVKTISYRREKLKLKKDVSKVMVSEKTLEGAMSIIDEIDSNIRHSGQGIPQKELDEVISNLITDIQTNEDAYLNLLDLFKHDDYTYTHSINVATISVLLGLSMKLDESKLKILGISSLLHDIGKSLISPDILDKPGKLTEDEWVIMKNHPVYSYNIIRAEGSFDPRVEKAVLLHHENYAGGGYPLGATHEKLDSFSQVITVADVFDALTTSRPYKAAWPINEAFTFLMENSGSKFNPQICQVFLRDMVKKINEEPLYPEDCYVLLNTGEIAYVVSHRSSIYTLRPIINIFFNPAKGKETHEKFLKYVQQIDLEQDYTRYIVKRINDESYIAKFDNILGKVRKPSKAQKAGPA